MAKKQYLEAAKSAIIIAEEEQINGKFLKQITSKIIVIADLKSLKSCKKQTKGIPICKYYKSSLLQKVMRI